MYPQNTLMEVARLRLQLQMNNRFRLEFQAALSRLFREHGVTVSDNLLASFILSVPEELLGQGDVQRVFVQEGMGRDLIAGPGRGSDLERLMMSSPPDPPPGDPPPLDPPPLDPPPGDPPPGDPPPQDLRPLRKAVRPRKRAKK